jgi:hypothetical protein
VRIRLNDAGKYQANLDLNSISRLGFFCASAISDMSKRESFVVEVVQVKTLLTLKFTGPLNLALLRLVFKTAHRQIVDLKYYIRKSSIL